MSHRKFFSFAAAYITVFGLISFTSLIYAQSVKQVSIPKVGNPAPNFSLQDFDGNKPARRTSSLAGGFELSKATQKHSVLLWFTNLCEGCQSKISNIERLESMYENKGVYV